MTYIWHIEKHGTDWFAVQQNGGWMKFASPEQAEAYIDRQVERGDRREDPPGSDHGPGMEH